MYFIMLKFSIGGNEVSVYSKRINHIKIYAFLTVRMEPYKNIYIF